MFVTETHIRVRYAETDQMNVVYYGNYAQYFEVARAESIRNLGFTYKEMEEHGRDHACSRNADKIFKTGTL